HNQVIEDRGVAVEAVVVVVAACSGVTAVASVSNNLFAKGYGTEFPVADNATEDGRVKNRRVELRWMGD
ncbi:MAG: hypothetical protein EB012_02025, partial [Gammaproteobacteria bacterium]|nr:hypothetical protein [Gammaproteobacteria bacterium]